MDSEALKHKYALLEVYTKRLRVLEIQHANMGIYSRPDILTEIEDINKNIHEIENEIKDTRNDDEILSPSLTEERFNGIFDFMDDNIIEQVEKLVILIQHNAKLQSNYDILKSLLDLIEDNDIDANMEDICEFIQSKIIDVMRIEKFHQCYYILARSSYMIGAYDDCSRYIELAITIEERAEYRFKNAEALYGLARGIFNSELNNLEYQILQSKPNLFMAKEKLLQAIANWEKAKKIGFGGRGMKSLREELTNLRKEINDRLQEIELIELEEQEKRRRDKQAARKRQPLEAKERIEEDAKEAEDQARRIFQQDDNNELES